MACEYYISSFVNLPNEDSNIFSGEFFPSDSLARIALYGICLMHYVMQVHW